MKNGGALTSSVFFTLSAAFALFMCSAVEGDPRTTTVKKVCSRQWEQNSSVFLYNSVVSMEKIAYQMPASRFGVAHNGKGPDACYALAQCYGDLSTEDCLVCYGRVRNLIPQCFPRNGGRVFLDGCFMRGENYSFYGEATGPADSAVCGNARRNGPEFSAAARGAVGRAIAAAVGGGGRGYARAEAKAGRHGSAYVLANCWTTLNATSCGACLRKAEGVLAAECLPASEGRALMAGCFLRYSDANFLNAEPGRVNSRGKTVVFVVTLILSSSAVLLAGGALGAYLWKHGRIQKKRRGLDNLKDMVKILKDSRLNFKLSTIDRATKSFDDANKLGQGGFGTVYKGVLTDGREIAVKRLFLNNRHRAADFYNEVNIISSVEHKNLVRLLGCSCLGPECLLIYEFLPNLSLDRFIFDPNKGRMLNWEKRLKIIIGMAEGLVYLHENPKVKIIHRDIKASNILLDSRFRAKIADFGLVRSFQEGKSHISVTAIAGTFGYMAPEYVARGQLTEKADVYSFGLVVLEIITGKQNNKTQNSESLENLVTVAWKLFQERTAEILFDPNLMLHENQNEDFKGEASRGLHIGLLCTQEDPSLRPTMSRVLSWLRDKMESLPAPSQPPFVDERTMEFNHTVTHSSFPLSPASMADISFSSFCPR